jgi:hypothetical protein
MYNLFVSGNETAWTGAPAIFEQSRCVREYTDSGLTQRFGELTAANVDELRRFPSIFAYESACNRNPRFGLLREATCRQGKVRIEYDLVPVEPFLTWRQLDDLHFELDIEKLELNRTHWALKDVNLGKELRALGITLPSGSCPGSSVDIRSHEFDAALTFPGEIRNRVEPIVAALEKHLGPNAYFYDDNYVAQLARPSLDVLLQEIYLQRSRLVVVFLCRSYQEKEWCGVEFRAVREIIKKRQAERVMYIRMDDGVVDGVFSTDGALDGRKHNPDDIARFIAERASLLKRK